MKLLFHTFLLGVFFPSPDFADSQVNLKCDQFCYDLDNTCKGTSGGEQCSGQNSEKCRATCDVCKPCDLLGMHKTQEGQIQSLEDEVEDLGKKIDELVRTPIQILMGSVRPDNTSNLSREDERPRSVYKEVHFQPKFAGKPRVVVTPHRVDMVQDIDLRLWVRALNVSEAGFVTEFHTWSDTKLLDLEARYFAHGMGSL